MRKGSSESSKELESDIPTNEIVSILSETFKVLGDPTKVKILYLLSKRELRVCDLSDLLGISQSAVSHQLRILRTLNLVKHVRKGKFVYYSLADEHVLKLIEMGIEHAKERVL